ncbi:glycosyl transferase family protein [Mycobacterium europaeum]|uniref:Glycosyl transferase family protein n=1 Tax=Mycobacterium europaeum TaxID=761804 RepID=A0A0U1DTX1_9MYCO|nr:glycosyltransferase family A protein [Mycobacterium europaeum]CQD22838.1 glycosyl transferase family protein [Mycobacterium europaeum]
MSAPEFSVLLPTRNRVELLAQAITTVRAQDEASWEIVVSDNASEEDVRGLVEGLDDPRIRYLRTDAPLPVTANWNRAADAATGRWVVMLGDDDGLTPGYMRTMREACAALADPDLIYHGAYHFMAPGVTPGQTQGAVFDVTQLHCMLRGRDAPVIIPPEEARAAVRAALDMRSLYGFNMQYFLFRREFLERLRAHGPVFRGPFPDFYTANLALLLASRVGVVPRPLTVIGITRKSYGYYHLNDAEAAGVDFLGNQHFRDEVTPELRKQLLPGSYMNTLWLVSVALVRDALPDDPSLRLGVGRYRRLQIVDTVLRHYSTRRPVGAALGQMRPSLSRPERALATLLRLALLPWRALPQVLREVLARSIARRFGQYGPQLAPRKLPLAPSNMLEVVDGLRCRAESTA